MPKKRPAPKRVIYRDAKGRFVAGRERYSKKVKMVQAVRGGELVVIAKRPLTPKMLADLLNQREFEAQPEAIRKLKDYTPKGKYQAWDLAEQIDKTRGVRRKTLKITMDLDDGGRKRTIEFYHTIKRTKTSSYQIFRRINQEVGIEGFFLYDKVGSKIIADRKGKQVKIIGMTVNEVI